MIYMDNAATTRLDPRVLDAMLPYLKEKYMNPSAFYASDVADAIAEARETVADFVGCAPEGVIFTSGGTEADNMAIAGAARMAFARTKKKTHILTTQIEHKAVLETCKALDNDGVSSTHYLKPDSTGMINHLDVDAMLDIDPALSVVSVMAVNNETGVRQPVEQIAGYCSRCETPVVFHTDAVQAIHTERFDMMKTGIDMLSMSAHKFNGPKGVGALCVSIGAKAVLLPLLRGGKQENGLRPGTENVAGIIGMAEAIRLLRDEWDERQKHVRLIDEQMRLLLALNIPDIIINGRMPRMGGTPGYISLSAKGVDAETMLVMLANNGIYASAGSACNTGSVEVSHVLKAMDVPEDYVGGTIRLTFSHETTSEEAETVCAAIQNIIEQLRKGAIV